jgi:hypothetical protein
MEARISTVAALATALIIIGGVPAQSQEAQSGSITAPYESASSQVACSLPSTCSSHADTSGNLRVEANAYAFTTGYDTSSSADASASAKLVAAHEIDGPANSLTYYLHFNVSAAEAFWDSDGGWSGLWLHIQAVHSTCGTCGTTSGWSSPVGSPPDLSVPVQVWNHAGGSVPAGTIRITVSLWAPAHAYVYGSWSGPSTASAKAKGVFELTSIDYEVEAPQTPGQPPTARFTVSCQRANYETYWRCTFDAGGSSDPEGGRIRDYNWDFGDGTLQNGPYVGNPIEHYYADGSKSYVVTLTVVDDTGGTDSETMTLTPESRPNQLPTARFTVSCVKTDCQFYGGGSSDPDGQITGYSWDFGDGAGSSGSSVQHRYPEGAASYVAILTVTDDRGGTDTESLIVNCTRKNQNKPTTCS